MLFARRWAVRGVRAGTGILGLTLLLAVPPAGAAQASPSESEQLREELEKVRREIQSLREENARLKGVIGGAPAATVAPAAAPAPGAGDVVRAGKAAGGRTIVVPEPIEEGALVTVEQLLADYRTSALAGDARYKGRRFRLEGTVDGFKKVFVGLTWSVDLRAGDALGLVRCTVSFPGVSDFRPSANNRMLEGRHPFKAWQVLLQSGQTLVLEGVGGGVDGPLVLMKACRPVGP